MAAGNIKHKKCFYDAQKCFSSIVFKPCYLPLNERSMSTFIQRANGKQMKMAAIVVSQSGTV